MNKWYIQRYFFSQWYRQASTGVKRMTSSTFRFSWLLSYSNRRSHEVRLFCWGTRTFSFRVCLCHWLKKIPLATSFFNTINLQLNATYKLLYAVLRRERLCPMINHGVFFHLSYSRLSRCLVRQFYLSYRNLVKTSYFGFLQNKTKKRPLSWCQSNSIFCLIKKWDLV